MDQQQFYDWFEKPIDDMITYDHGGFAVLMIAIPLAERFYRERSGCAEGDLTNDFYDEFIKEFPNLDRQKAKEFWHVHRNGLLHQATFSLRTKRGAPMPGTWITSLATPNAPEIINYNAAANEFLLKPREFAKKIISTIKADWATFEAPNAPAHRFATVEGPRPWTAPQTQTPNPILGQQASSTGNPPQAGFTGCPGPQPPPPSVNP
jgi:hypothetical protein